jgi:hypothetical protein
MGYTHYFYTVPSLGKSNFKIFAKVANNILSTEEAKATICYERDKVNKKPEITNEVVRFNGKGDDGHETFMFSRETEVRSYQEDKTMAFNFCKTAQKSYDKYVVACLILAKLYFGNDVKISSDGDLEDWEEGKQLVENELGEFDLHKVDGRFEISGLIVSA